MLDPVQNGWILTYQKDPESDSWDPLDGELMKKLDERPYVSLSRDRRLASQAASAPTQGDSATHPDAGENDEDMSLFDIHMPGVLTLEEVKALDLDHWLLLVHGSFVHMIVSVSLREDRPCSLFSLGKEPFV